MVRTRPFGAVSNHEAPMPPSFETATSQPPQDEDLSYARTAANPSVGAAKPALEA